MHFSFTVSTIRDTIAALWQLLSLVSLFGYICHNSASFWDRFLSFWWALWLCRKRCSYSTSPVAIPSSSAASFVWRYSPAIRKKKQSAPGRFGCTYVNQMNLCWDHLHLESISSEWSEWPLYPMWSECKSFETKDAVQPIQTYSGPNVWPCVILPLIPHALYSTVSFHYPIKSLPHTHAMFDIYLYICLPLMIIPNLESRQVDPWVLMKPIVFFIFFF